MSTERKCQPKSFRTLGTARRTVVGTEVLERLVDRGRERLGVVSRSVDLDGRILSEQGREFCSDDHLVPAFCERRPQDVSELHPILHLDTPLQAKVQAEVNARFLAIHSPIHCSDSGTSAFFS